MSPLLKPISHLTLAIGKFLLAIIICLLAFVVLNNLGKMAMSLLIWITCDTPSIFGPITRFIIPACEEDKWNIMQLLYLSVIRYTSATFGATYLPSLIDKKWSGKAVSGLVLSFFVIQLVISPFTYFHEVNLAIRPYFKQDFIQYIVQAIGAICGFIKGYHTKQATETG